MKRPPRSERQDPKAARPRRRGAVPDGTRPAQQGADAPHTKRARILPRAARAGKDPEIATARPASDSVGDDPGTGVRVLTVDAAAEGQRLDNFLLRHLKGVPRSHLYRLTRRGEVRVNKGRVKPDHRLHHGDQVRIPPLRLPGTPSAPRIPTTQLAGLEEAVLYEDGRLLVIDKPSGLAVHGGSGLSHGLIEALRMLRPGCELELVHRLDRETSGCLILSKRRSTLRDLHAALRAGEIRKTYLALLVGDLERSSVSVDAPLRKNVLQSGERMVRVDPVNGKPARTLFQRLRRWTWEGGILTLAEVRLLTGRTHQIRVHAAHLGCPLAGDERYGLQEVNRALKAWGLRRLFLHARALNFQVGEDARAIAVEAPLPDDLTSLLRRLERDE